MFEIATKVFITHNFNIKCLYQGKIPPHGPWGTALAHLQKYIGG